MRIHVDDLYLGLHDGDRRPSRLVTAVCATRVTYTDERGIRHNCRRETFRMWAGQSGHRLAARLPQHRNAGASA